MKVPDSPVSTNPSKKRKRRTRRKATPSTVSEVDFSTDAVGDQGEQPKQGDRVFPSVKSTEVPPQSIDSPTQPKRKRVLKPRPEFINLANQ